MQYVCLVGAIIAEVIATLSLRTAAKGRTAFYALVGLGYLAALVLCAFGTLPAGGATTRTTVEARCR